MCLLGEDGMDGLIRTQYHTYLRYLVVTTSLQCCVYLLQNLNTPHIFDLKVREREIECERARAR